MRLFITDCEGPISKNDNAFELARHFLPSGERFFTQISRYDDFLALKGKEGYKAGDTLKLILPFLKAYGVTDEQIVHFSQRSILLMPSVKHTLQFIRKRMPSFIISTSYKPYIKALCEVIDFPLENVYCTEVSLDKYPLSTQEIAKIKEFNEYILSSPLIDTSDFLHPPADTREVVTKLDEIFWKEIVSMEIGRILREVNPVGGREKVNAIKEILGKGQAAREDAIYVGDSITDMEALEFIREGGGLAISFNGNRYAITKAEVAIISQDTLPLALLADVFFRRGKEEAVEFVQNHDYTKIDNKSVDVELKEKFVSRSPKELPCIEVITESNRADLITKSEWFRKNIRGEVGTLG